MTYPITKRILITGGAGFIGSNLAIALKKKYPRYEVVALDNLSRKGSALNVPRLRKSGVRFIRGDVRFPASFKRVGRVSAVVECSADPSVLSGISSGPEWVIDNNLMGAVNCLNWALKCKADFIFLSTSRVYPIEKLEGLAYHENATRFEWRGKGIAENFPLEGCRSLYGATKLCAELLIGEYGKFYGLRTVINRCGVIAGPWQMGKIDQGVVTLWVARHFWRKKLSYLGYGGRGKQVRDVLHVDDLWRLVDYELHHMARVNGGVFNVGGGRRVSASLMELTRLCEKITGNRLKIGRVVARRPADIRIYLTDHRKVTKVTGWKPRLGLEKIVRDIHRWIRENQKVLEPILS